MTASIPLANAIHQNSDIDVLMDRAELASAADGLRRSGFVRVPLVSFDAHVHFLKYMADRNSWVWLDIATELRFGPYGCLRIPAERACLERAVGGELSRADQFWIQLLHTVLDRPELESRHRERLRSLFDASSPNDDLAGRMREFSFFRDFVARSDWAGFAEAAAVARAQVAERYRWYILRCRFAVVRRFVARHRVRGIAIQMNGPVALTRPLAEEVARSVELPLRALAKGTAPVTLIEGASPLLNCIRSRRHTIGGGLAIWLVEDPARMPRWTAPVAGIVQSFDASATPVQVVDAIWRAYARRWQPGPRGAGYQAC